MTQYYLAKTIILEDSEVDDAYLVVTDGVIDGVVTEVPEGGEVIDYSNYILAPGLVDTHIHGYKNYDVMDADPAGLQVMAESLPSCGVTSWLPTTLTDSTENLNKACRVIAEHYRELSGAKVQGIFLEGPYFTEKYQGAQNPKYMSDPSTEQLDEWLYLSEGLVNKIAIAPERDGATEFIKHAGDKEVHVALAHSDATFEEATEAIKAGAKIFIHLYNGMSGLHHRNPGMVGAALASKETVFTEIIADGHHVHPGAIQVVKNARSAEEIVLVTDCMRAGGIGEGKSSLGEFPVYVKDGQARMVKDDNLAGSILELIDGVQNLVKWGIASVYDAVRMASLNPAKSVGIDDVCGKLAPDYAADFIVIDEEVNLKATYINGEKHFSL
ncbi:N-acetylglucosamine-6-phosphate deacetylase [Aerococcaceae bacterium DSM 111022]|nr:N-acetylglucosamine-6-phosphate deacetylase [Aerococcaceae bacterium DSM 111022]